MVAKFGTNLLTGGTGRLDIDFMAGLVEQTSRLYSQKLEVVIVSSGAVAAGRQKLGLTKERKDIPFKQVLASIGQSELLHTYEKLFSQHNITVAQALLTKSDIVDRAGYLNTRNTLLALIELGVICIVNENDVVCTDEIGGVKFGDNDNLSAMVANLVDADLLVLLTDIDGLYTADPQCDPEAKLISRVEVIDDEIMQLAGKAITSRGVGGMITKIEAARLATASGVTVIIASGREPDALRRIVAEDSLGTVFTPRTSKLESKKRWMLSGLASRGKLIIDNGAVLALREQSKSLLPAGVVTVEGEFRRGDVVDIFDLKGSYIGCGITNYDFKDVSIIKGSHSETISTFLGYEYGAEVVNRSNMVLI